MHHLNHRRGLTGVSPPTDGAGPPRKYTASESAAETRDVLDAVAAREKQHLFCSRTRSALELAVSEFSTYLQYAAEPGRNTWATCTDLEVLVFIERHYLPAHSGRVSDSVAPSTLASMLSRLSRAFVAHHRAGPWCGVGGAGPLGNPVESQSVRDYQHAYARCAQCNGRAEVSAVPLREEVLRAIVDGLDAETQELSVNAARTGLPNWPATLLLVRDATFFTVLWSSCRRGQDVLRLTWPRLYAALDGDCSTSLVSDWLRKDPRSLSVGSVHAVPLQTKTEQIGRPCTWTFTRAPPDQARYCAIARLQHLCFVLQQASVEDFQQGPVFTGFTQRCSGAMSSNAMARRLTRALSRLPAPLQSAGRSLTLHSFRRGRLQHEHARGATPDELQALSGIKTYSILQRYLDVGRHLR